MRLSRSSCDHHPRADALAEQDACVRGVTAPPPAAVRITIFFRLSQGSSISRSGTGGGLPAAARPTAQPRIRQRRAQGRQRR